jgi:hypothetical protein
MIIKNTIEFNDGSFERLNNLLCEVRDFEFTYISKNSVNLQVRKYVGKDGRYFRCIDIWVFYCSEEIEIESETRISALYDL